MGCDLISLLRTIFVLNFLFLCFGSRSFGGRFDRAVGRRESRSRVVDRAQAQQVVDLVQATLGPIDIPLGALNVIVSILDRFAELRGLLTRKRDCSVVCCHVSGSPFDRLF